MGHDAFISFCSQERRIADACVEALEEGGWACWISHRDIVPGKDYGEAIIDAINEARSLVLIFSKSADDSPHVLREVERAVNRRMPVITFRVEDRTPRKALEYFLSSPHWLDAWTEPLEPHLERLGRTLEALLGPPTPPPAAPPPVEAPASTAPPTEREACPQCGAENSARAVFCPHCGLALVETCGFCGDEGRTALPYCAGCGANKPAYEQAAKLLAQAKAALQAHRYEEALTATTSGLELGELAEDLRVLAERATRHLSALEEFEPGLERHLEAADFDAASTLIEVVERSKPGDDRFERARERIATARRSHEVRETLERARADLETDRRFERALAGCAHALELEPDHPEALSLRDRATKVEADYVAQLAEVERCQEERAWERALSALQGLSDEFPWSEEVARRRETVSRLQQEDARVRDLRAGLPALLEAQQVKAARAALDQILRLRPGDEEAKAQRKALKRRILPRRATGRAQPPKDGKTAPREGPAAAATDGPKGAFRRSRTLALLGAVVVVIGLAIVFARGRTKNPDPGDRDAKETAARVDSADPSSKDAGEPLMRPVAEAPDMIGWSRATAEAWFDEHGWSAVFGYAVTADRGAVGTIVGQVPGSGSPLAKGVVFKLTVGVLGAPAAPPAAPPAVVTAAPHMIGWSRETAEAWCYEHGWSTVFGEAVTADPSAVGTIVGQVPGSGSPLAEGDVFKLTVGVEGAPAAPPAVVKAAPDLLGWTRSRADAWCRENGQLVEVLDQLTEHPTEVGAIVDQDPPPGEPLSASALFTLRVGVLKETPRPSPSAPPPSALEIGDVVPDYELVVPGGAAICSSLSSLNASPAAVEEWALTLARAFGAESPDLSTRLDAFLLTDPEDYPRKLHWFVSAVGRSFGLLPSKEVSRSMQSLDDVTRWVVSHARDPIVLVPWSFQCRFCTWINEELGEVLAASGARCIALGGQYGDTGSDLEKVEEENSFPYLLVDDTSHRIADELGLGHTCRFAVLDADRKLHYRGVLSSKQSSGTGIDQEGAWLADAIEAVKRGGLCFVPPPNDPPNVYG